MGAPRYHEPLQIAHIPLAALAALWWAAAPLPAQPPSDPPAPDQKLRIGIEQRIRLESRDGNGFGRDPDIDTGLLRTRFSLTYEPAPWIRLSGMAQDVRAPWYGNNAPNNMRDPLDLQEGYVELRPRARTGFGMTAGRMMLTYGEGRLIGVPQWSNTSRTYDHARVYFRGRRMRLEALLVSQVKVRTDAWNRPMLGDRLWGVYNTFPGIGEKGVFDVYVLRRDQNRPGGFTGGSTAAGTARLELNTAGFRLAGPLAAGLKYSVEAAAQNGWVGPARHFGSAWFALLGRRVTAVGKPLDLSVEYKFASGSRNPADPLRSRTFDQLYASNHDRFGHEDLFGWRNICDLRALATWSATRRLAVNAMYNDFWLANAHDALYNSSGKAIVRVSSGAAGRHVGREADLFGTWKYGGHFQVGAGFGRMVPGGFLRAATPGASPNYLYIFHTFSL